MDRHIRFKALRLIWGRARQFLTVHRTPHEVHQRQQAQYHAQQAAIRLTQDGIPRGSDDPDVRRQTEDMGHQSAARQAQWQAQQEWREHQERQWRAQHGRRG